MASRVLYWGSGSAPAWRALIALEEKGLSYESKLIEFSKGGHKTPEIIAINPRGQVPTFKDGDAVVNESLAIIAYVEVVYPEPSLLPKDKVGKALVWQRFIESNNLMTKLSDVGRMKLMGKIDTPEKQAEFESKVQAAKEELKLWNTYLSSGAYVAGETFTIADVAIAPFMVTLSRYGAKLTDYPHVKAYIDKIKDRPSVTSSWPPHWKTSPDATWLGDYL